MTESLSPLNCPGERGAEFHNSEQAGKENRQIFMKYQFDISLESDIPTTQNL